MSKAVILENVILFARAGFRGINDATQVESVMTAVAESLEGTDLVVDGEAVGTIEGAHVDGSLIRGDASILDPAFLATEAGLNLIRRIGAHVEAPAKPAKKAIKPAAKPAKKATKAADPAEDETPEEQAEPAPAKTAKKPAAKPTAKPAPGKGKPVIPMNKKIKVSL
jgi:hypothetical protein